jgi:hypothetical protein
VFRHIRNTNTEASSTADNTNPLTCHKHIGTQIGRVSDVVTLDVTHGDSGSGKPVAKGRFGRLRHR